MRWYGEDDVDMTPMADVTFLLLIFFMITAAFALQKSIEVPPSNDEKAAQASTIEEFEEDSIIIRIDGDNIFWVSSPGWSEEKEASSSQDMLIQLRRARREAFQSGLPAPSRLVVLASGDATHQRVVTALDAGNEIGMEDILLATLEDDEY